MIVYKFRLLKEENKKTNNNFYNNLKSHKYNNFLLIHTIDAAIKNFKLEKVANFWIYLLFIKDNNI